MRLGHAGHPVDQQGLAHALGTDNQDGLPFRRGENIAEALQLVPPADEDWFCFVQLRHRCLLVSGGVVRLWGLEVVESSEEATQRRGEAATKVKATA